MRQLPNLGDVALPAQHGLEPVHGRRLAERRHPVEGDPTARGVEVGFGDPQGGRTVRNVPDHVRVAGRRRPEPFDLGAREGRIGVRGREMAHQPDDVDRRRRQLGQAPAAHPGVELEVDADALGDRLVEHREVEVCVARLGDVPVGARPEDEDAHAPELAPKRQRLGDGRHAKRQRAFTERRACDVDRAVPVAVGLDHGP